MINFPKQQKNINTQTHKKDTPKNSDFYFRYIVQDIDQYKITVYVFNYKRTIPW
jgi:hypothetical protein